MPHTKSAKKSLRKTEVRRIHNRTVIRVIKTHIKRVYQKLAVHSKGEAVYEAQRLGLLPTPGSSSRE